MADHLSPKHREKLTREHIRTTAVRLFREKGYETTTVEEIADATDVSTQTLSRHFPSKEDILFGRVESFIPAAKQVILGTDAEVPDWEALRHGLRTYGAYLQSREGDVRLVLDLIHTSPELHGRRTLMQEGRADEIAETLAKRRGRDEANFADLALVSAALAIYRIAVLRWLAATDLRLPELIEETFVEFDEARERSRP